MDDDEVVLKAIKDKSGWRVQFHLHAHGQCLVLEGQARFTTKAECDEHGQLLHHVIDQVIGLLVPKPSSGPVN